MASLIPVATITSRSAAFTGATVDFVDARRAVSMVLIVTGICTGGVVRVEASQDGANFVDLAAMTPTTGVNQVYSNTAGAFRYWRARIVVPVTGGGSVSATFMEADR